MSDSIRAVTEEIREFRDARDWLQFHNPKELAVAITAEAGELLQHFVWQSAEQANKRAVERKEEIGKEMADVAILLARPRKGPLITRKLSDYSLGLYAPADRPEWRDAAERTPLARAGIPVIGYMPDILYAPELDYLGEIEPGLRATVRSSSILAQRRMIAGGAGVGVLPCFLAADDPALVRVRADQLIARAFWLALHRDVAPQPRIRAFIEWLDAEVRENRSLLVPD